VSAPAPPVSTPQLSGSDSDTAGSSTKLGVSGADPACAGVDTRGVPRAAARRHATTAGVHSGHTECPGCISAFPTCSRLGTACSRQYPSCMK
jgi:hypothetical protein